MKWLTLITMIVLPIFAFADNIQQRLLSGDPVLETDPLEVDKMTYSIFGNSDHPWMILVHGLGGNKNAWSSVIADLSKDYHLLVVDQRGHGENAISKENYSSSTMARDLLALMDKLQIEKAHLVGHSMGGRTVMRFGAAYPTRTLTITVEDMHAIGRTKLLEDFTELSRKIRPLFQPSFVSAEDFYRIYQPYMNWLKRDDLYNFGYTDRLTGRFHLYSRPHVTLLYQNQALQEDLTKALVAIKSPITFLAAGREGHAVLFGKGLDHIKANKPEAKIIVFEKHGHSIHVEDPSGFTQELRKTALSKMNGALPISCKKIY